MMAKRQLFIFGAIFAVVVASLALAYFWFLRADYVPIFENLRESDASTIVAELDKQGIAYQLANGGHDIKVAEEDVGPARLALAGSGVALGGVVGFELFNESDMGLTEFAQKINYQRAMQGELARTIMMMNGIEFARVHLALPEKTIFRAAQSQPTAAVTIQTVDRKDLSPDRVAGIQQLVASAVPDMPLGNVAILDDRGDLLSTVTNSGAESGAVLDERTALEQYFRARAQAAIAQAIPGLHAEVKILATKLLAAPGPASGTPTNDTTMPAAAASTNNEGRDFQLKAIIRTVAALNDEDAGLLRSAVAAAIKVDPADQNAIQFEVGPLGFTPGQAAPLSFDATDDGVDKGSGATAGLPSSGPRWMDYVFSRWFLALLAIAGVIFWLLWRQRGQMNEEEQESFADLLADGLAVQQAGRHAG